GVVSTCSRIVGSADPPCEYHERGDIVWLPFTVGRRFEASGILALTALAFSACFSSPGSCTPGFCGNDNECGSGRVCNEGVCAVARACNSNADCSGGEVCGLRDPIPARHPFEDDGPSTQVCRCPLLGDCSSFVTVSSTGGFNHTTTSAAIGS